MEKLSEEAFSALLAATETNATPPRARNFGVLVAEMMTHLHLFFLSFSPAFDLVQLLALSRGLRIDKGNSSWRSRKHFSIDDS